MSPPAGRLIHALRPFPVLIAAALLPLAWPVEGHAGALYAVTDLGTLGGRQSQALGISPNGYIAGWALTAAGQQHAFLYKAGVMHDLGTLGGRFSIAYAVNSSGEVMGFGGTAGGETHAFLYNGGPLVDLGTFGGPTSYAFGINTIGQVVGGAVLADGLTEHAFLYDGTKHDLGTLGGSGGSEARAVNDAGQITGSASTASGAAHAFLFSGASKQDLGTLPNGTFSIGYGMNDLGQVVGYGDTGQFSQRAFLWTPTGGMQDLGPSGSNSIGRAINDRDQVVGTSTSLGPFLYQHGVMVGLNGLIPASSGWDLSQAAAINDAGEIVGDGANPHGFEHAFLLTPVPEPGRLILLATGMATCLAYCWWGSTTKSGRGSLPWRLSRPTYQLAAGVSPSWAVPPFVFLPPSG
jgi:probable HAF family extracellular repeat protein